MNSAQKLHSDRDEIADAIAILINPGDVFELRIPKAGRFKTISGYFDNAADLIKSLSNFPADQLPGVYVTLNPVNPSLMARANNKAQPYAEYTSTDKDIVRRRWLPLDFDAVRPAGISSSDEEHDAAHKMAVAVRDYLDELGWPVPIYADSGNGAHLLYRIDLPNDDEALSLIKAALESLSDKFSDEVVKVDRAVHNAARIWKLYGTVGRKGENLHERPHRMARVIYAPQSVEGVAAEKIRALAPERQTTKPSTSVTTSRLSRDSFDLGAWITRNGIESRGPFDHNGGAKWILSACPFNPEHNRGEAMLGTAPGGGIYFKCQHDSCSRYRWDDVRALYEGPRTAKPSPTIIPESPANDNRVADTDYISPLFDVNGRGKPLSTIENLREICRRLGVTIRYNVISKEEEILVPDEAFTIDNGANASIGWLISWCNRFGMPAGNLGDYVTYLADKNLYNPVANWITSRPWDGVDRLKELCSTIVAEGERDPEVLWLKETLIRRWLLSAVAAAFEPNGVSAHGVLVLQGGQYLGKTKWFKSLVPDHLGVVQDGMMLRPDDRDSVKQVCSFWLVELGELDATFRKSDIAALKSFITRKNDVLRRAYARRDSQFARRTVFFGSVNPKEFLHDATGNRRYWTIECKAIDHSHTIDMQQLWAQVHALYEDREPYYLQPDEMAALNDHNEGFMTADPLEDRLASVLKWDAPENIWSWKTATETLVLVGIDKPTQSESTRAGIAIRKLNGDRSERKGGRTFLLVPPI